MSCIGNDATPSDEPVEGRLSSSDVSTPALDQPQVKFGESSSDPKVELDPESSLRDEPVEGLSGGNVSTPAPDQPQVKFGECYSHPEVELDPKSNLRDEPVEGLCGGNVSTPAPDQLQVKFGECSSHPEVELDPDLLAVGVDHLAVPVKKARRVSVLKASSAELPANESENLPVKKSRRKCSVQTTSSVFDLPAVGDDQLAIPVKKTIRSSVLKASSTDNLPFKSRSRKFIN